MFAEWISTQARAGWNRPIENPASALARALDVQREKVDVRDAFAPSNHRV